LRYQHGRGTGHSVIAGNDPETQEHGLSQDAV